MALTTNLVAYWKLDGNSNDATANGHNGTDTSITYSTTNAVINSAAQFGGNIKIPDSAGFDGTSAISMAGWFYATSVTTGTQTLIGKSDSTATHYMYLRMLNGTGKAGASFNGDGTLSISGSTAIILNTRYHLAATYDGTTLSLYLNGVKDATDITVSAAVVPGTGSVGIGILGDFASQSGQPFAGGTIDECGWWSRGLTSTEITQLYNSGAGLAYPFTTSNVNSNFLAFM